MCTIFVCTVWYENYALSKICDTINMVEKTCANFANKVFNIDLWNCGKLSLEIMTGTSRSNPLDTQCVMIYFIYHIVYNIIIWTIWYKKVFGITLCDTINLLYHTVVHKVWYSENVCITQRDTLFYTMVNRKHIVLHNVMQYFSK